jgi:ABC-type multidrug transport system ATPase subunit
MNNDSKNLEQFDKIHHTDDLLPQHESSRIDLSRKAILDAEQLLKASEQLLKDLSVAANVASVVSERDQAGAREGSTLYHQGSFGPKPGCAFAQLDDNKEPDESQLGSRACLASSALSTAANPSHQLPAATVQDEATLPALSNSALAISTTSLSKTFGKLEAVKNVCLNIPYGQIYGLLGARRSGKSTTLRLLSGLLAPTMGTCLIAGSEINPDNRTTLRQLGYMSQKFVLHDDLSVLENLQFYAAASSLPIKMRREKINWLLEFCDLEPVKDTKVQGLPRSVRQRTALGANILHEPSILLLDEPTAGLKPDHRHQLWHVISEFASLGNAVVVTTPFLSDAEYCHRLGLMLNGSVVSEGDPDEIMDSAYRILRVKSTKPPFALELLTSMLETLLLSVIPRRVQSPDKMREKVAQILGALGVDINELRTAPASYDDAFLKLSFRRRSQG